MITEKDVEQYLDKPVRVELTDGTTFDGIYKYRQLDVADDVPDAMELYPLNGLDIGNGVVEIEAVEIISVKPLDSIS